MNTPKIISYSEWVNNAVYHAIELELDDPHAIVPFNPEMVECKSCWGEGRVKCEHCNGKGHFECKTCDRTGFDEDGDQCEICQGQSDTVCIICDGKKDYTCSECNGTGKMIPEEYEYLALEFDDYESQKREDIEKWKSYHG